MAVSVTDLQDGTGITATSSGNATAVLYAGLTGSGVALAEIADITGNGSQTVSLGAGAYVGVWLVDSVWQEPFRFRVTEAAQGIHEQCLNAIRDILIDGALPGYPTDPAKYQIHKRPLRSLAEFGSPLHGVHLWPVPETFSQTDNVRNGVTFPVQVVLVRGNDGGNEINSGWIRSREMIFQLFPRQPLTAVPEIHTVTIRPGAIYAELDGQLNLDLQSLIFDCVTDLCFVAL